MGAPKGNKFAAGNKGGGRKPIYSEKLCPIVKRMVTDGATPYEIAEALGISTETLRFWRWKHDEFRNAMNIPNEALLERARTSLAHRAFGYTFKSEKVFQYQGRIIRAETTEHVPPDVTAAWNLMKSLDPQTWKDRSEQKQGVTFSFAEIVKRSFELERQAAEAKTIEGPVEKEPSE